jgi:hypothetical protein
MQMNHFYQIITLLLAIGNFSYIAPFSPTINIPEIKFPETIKIKPDFSGLGDELGKAGKETAKGTLNGIMEGISEATQSEELRRHVRDSLTNVASTFTDGMNDQNFRDEIRQGTDAWGRTAEIGAKGFADNLDMRVLPHFKRSFQNFWGSFISFENAFRFGTPIALGIALPLAGIYGSRVFWNVLEKRLSSPKPKILLPGSKYGRWDRISRWRAGYKSPAMIFDQQVKDRLMEIQEKTKNIRDNIRNGRKTTYDNLLLYGQPGTGKTLFAQILADETDMDFLPVTAASLLQSGVEGIKYFDELLDMANRSKYGAIIFVDEADALFVNRDSLNPESDHYKVLNHILALTGTGSNKFMLVAATNHAYVMDQAMGRRFQDRVLMPLPGPVTRQELIDLYTKQILFNTKENNDEFIKKAKTLLTPSVINNIVIQTDGLSHAEIKDMIVAMHKKANATKTGMITAAHVQKATAEAIQKKQALEEDKKLREQLAQKNNPVFA